MPRRGIAWSAAELRDWVEDARAHSFALTQDLSEKELLGPRLDIVNPLLWEVGHVAWFQERWVLRHALSHPPLRADGDALYDSAKVAHDTRWDLPLPAPAETFAYASRVRDRVCEALEAPEPDDRLRYFVLLSVYHEDMHTEAFTYTRQTLACAPPRPPGAAPAADEPPVTTRERARLGGEVEIPGGVFELGASPDEPFVFDNEKWAHPVEVAPFALSRVPVTEAEFETFVAEQGYRRRELWSPAGWRWRCRHEVVAPLYWRQDASGRWWRRVFDRWRELEPALPMLHVNAYEAEAYCRFVGRRLPSEAEWELAAAGSPDPGRKRRFPWGEEPPRPVHARLDWGGGGPAPVTALAAGESAFGCRHLIGNVWEWTSSIFGPYPGFEPDPYREYSEPWFGTHRVLRGGCWATRARLLRNTWRNFYEPHRRDVWAGFRTARSLEPGC